MKELLLGIDAGTTHIKAAVFDTSGVQQSLSIKENKLFSDDAGFSYYDPYELISTVFDAVSDALDKLTGTYAIIGVSVASMAEAGLPLDREGNPLYHIITWFDHRTVPQASWWKENFGDYEIYKETGLILQPKYSINKIMWIRDNLPDLYKNIGKWVCVEDYIIFKLTGKYATDRTIAHRTMAMDLKTCRWSDKLLRASGINEEMLPPIVRSGTIAGYITKKASEMTLLKEGTPVVTGGHDHLCAALALGVVEDGEIYDSMGTAETIVEITNHAEASADIFRTNFSIGRHVDGDMFYIMGGMQSSGASVEWFTGNFIGDAERTEKYEQLSEMIKAMKDDPTGILFMPHFSGGGPPNFNPMSRGCFVGLTRKHSKADILKSIYEGASFEFRIMKDSLEQLFGTKVEGLKIGGGSTKNNYWMKTKANVLGLDLDIPEIDESAAMGAAILSGIGLGVYKNGKDAAGKLKTAHRYIKRDEEISRKYDYLYKNAYVKLYNAVKPVNDVLSAYDL